MIAYLQRANKPALAIYKNPAIQPARAGLGHFKLLWIALVGLVVAAPLGLLAPGTAWGEWNAEQLSNNGLGFIPQGMARLSEIWGAPMSGYDLISLKNPALGYTLSAVIGVLLVIFMAWLFATLFATGKSEKL